MPLKNNQIKGVRILNNNFAERSEAVYWVGVQFTKHCFVIEDRGKQDPYNVGGGLGVLSTNNTVGRV